MDRLSPLLFLAAALTLAADQGSKAWVGRRCAKGRSFRPLPGVCLRRVHRPTSPRTSGGVLAIVSWMVLAGALTGLIQFAGYFPHPIAQAALGAALGGAAGNILDRVFRHGVVDVVDLGGWPAFNLADCAITAGVPIAFVLLR